MSTSTAPLESTWNTSSVECRRSARSIDGWPVGESFTLTFFGQTTPAILVDAFDSFPTGDPRQSLAFDIQTALNNLIQVTLGDLAGSATVVGTDTSHDIALLKKKTRMKCE